MNGDRQREPASRDLEWVERDMARTQRDDQNGTDRRPSDDVISTAMPWLTDRERRERWPIG